MYINRKPSGQIEFDWVGDLVFIIHSDTGILTKAYMFVGVMFYSLYVYAEAFINENNRHGL